MESEAALRQRRHYETIHDAYEAHYYDNSSIAYRERFIYEPLFRSQSFDNQLVADLACGSGFNSQAIQKIAPSARCVGFDISESACESYRRVTGFDAHVSDLTTDQGFEPIFDAAIVIGGLHHCVSNLPTTFANITAMLKPGGILMMMEPNSKFALNAVRQWWYRNDKWFDAETEAPLDHDEIARMAPQFEVERVNYGGGPAFYLILNSLVTRVPLGLKPWLSPILMPAELAWNALPGAAPYAFFNAVWRKRGVSG